MTCSIAASHAQSNKKNGTDKIFGANAAAVKAAAVYGKDKVVNATIGAFMDEQEVLACVPTIEKVYKALPTKDIISYAPIAGLPGFLDAIINLTFADNKPDAHIAAVATAGGSGALHHTIWNYSEIGDTILTSDWYWQPYETLCENALRSLTTYTLFDEEQKFNIASFSAKVKELLEKQNNLVIIINTPAHNPTGFSLTDSDWDAVLSLFKECAADQTKKIVPLIDVAYIDYAGEKNACRSFLKKMGGLPWNVMPILAASMSKGFTMYGQRTGAMIGIAATQEIIEEFKDLNQTTSRATWSNINNGAMKMMSDIYNDKELLAQMESERNEFYALIHRRAEIFMTEAKAANLHMLPYIAGFFLTVPSKNPDAVCEKLHEDNIFAVPLGKGIRIAVCAVTTEKITGMAAKVAKAIELIDN